MRKNLPIMLTLSCLMLCCKTNTKVKYSSPPGYNMGKPIKINLPLDLDEISGLNYYPKDKSVFAISDEKGILFKIKPNISISQWKFSSHGDFEDVTRIDSTIYVLKSNGDVFKVNYVDNELATETFPFEYGKGNEFEIIYLDKQSNKLILICKDCESDKKKSLTTYSFDPSNNSFSDSSFTIDIKQLDKILQEKSIKFKPSAAALNPVDSLLYIISSINKILLVTDRNGIIKNAYRIDPALFKQPEGITFTDKGDMIISNEYAKSGTANLLIFKYEKPKR